MVTHIVHVGDDTDLKLSAGRLYHSEEIDLEFRHIAVDSSARMGGERILNVTISGPALLNLGTPGAFDHIIKMISESEQLIRARSNYSASRGEQVPWTWYTFDRNQVFKGFKLLRSETGTIESMGSTYESTVPQRLQQVLKKENEAAVQQQRAQQAQERAQMIARLQEQRENQWKHRWSAQLVRADPWSNTADMLRFDLSESLIALRTGQQISISVRDISISNDKVLVRTSQRFTDVYEGIPQNEITITDFLKFTQSVGQRAGYVISCSLPFKDLDKISEGQTYIVDARLISFNNDMLNLACRNPRK